MCSARPSRTVHDDLNVALASALHITPRGNNSAIATGARISSRYNLDFCAHQINRGAAAAKHGLSGA